MITTQPPFAERLLRWFDDHGRKNLPWQVEPTSYRIWISEIMLQQTQVSTVIPYYQRFMESFPNILDLANASLDRVLQHWAGLGYYARARNLHKAAQHIIQFHQGQFPTDFESVVALPGIGPSTAGAILAFSTHQRFTILDGNVKRILCRHEAFDKPVNNPTHHAALWQWAEHYTPHQRVADYTQAIMDLGATLCTRTKPRCLDCPIQQTCQAFHHNNVLNFPVKNSKPPKPTKKRFFLLAIHPKQGILLYQRPSQGIWGGLWSLPEWEAAETAEDTTKAIRLFCRILLKNASPLLKMPPLTTLPVLSHQFTHYQLLLTPLLLRLSSNLSLPFKKALSFHKQPMRWSTVDQLATIGLPAPIKRIIEQYCQGIAQCPESSIA